MSRHFVSTLSRIPTQGEGCKGQRALRPLTNSCRGRCTVRRGEFDLPSRNLDFSKDPMKKIPGSITQVIVFIAFMFAPANASSAPTSATKDPARVERLVKEIDELWRGASSHAQATMRVKTSHYDRKLQIQAQTKGRKRTLIRIVAPKNEEGSATLKSDKEIYSYLPKTDRTIQLTSSMMMSPWMGSHFTNDDLARDSSLVDDYEKEISYEGNRAGENIVEITLRPKPDAPVVWGKMVITTRASDNMPLREDYFDEEMKLVRVMYLSEIKVLGGRKLPTVERIVPADKPQEFTELVYEKLEFNTQVEDSYFSLAQLRRR